MGSGPVLNPYALRGPYKPDLLVDLTTGQASDKMDRYLRDLDSNIQSIAGIDVSQYGARGNGVSDDTVPIQMAINNCLNQGGGVVKIPFGAYSVNSLFIPAGNIPIILLGEGNSTKLLRRADLTPGNGLLDISGSNVTISSMVIDGATTVPKGLAYNLDFQGVGGNDPLSPVLTNNSSLWLHKGTSNLALYRVVFQHTGGYAVLLDAMGADIKDVRITDCQFVNNRPFLFGVAAGNLIYGSWGGGIFAKGDGRVIGAGVVRHMLVSRCKFSRDTGNCVWSHLFGLEDLHEDFRWTDNEFTDCGLDGLLPGGVIGVVCTGNVFRRIGYICLDDTSQGTPRWLMNANATALDTSGLVKNAIYANNTFVSINGGAIDGDGLGDSVIAVNTVRTPYPDEPEYIEDQISITGPTNSGPQAYGLNMGNSQNTPYGGSNVSVIGNTLVNLNGGALRLFSARNCHIIGNNIISPDSPEAPPIAYGPIGPGTNQRANGLVIRHNRINYSPPIPAHCIVEDPTAGAFVASDVNTVCGNVPITGVSGLAAEFVKNINSGAIVYAQTVWFP